MSKKKSAKSKQAKPTQPPEPNSQASAESAESKPSRLQDIKQAVSGAASSVGSAATHAGQAVAGTAVTVGGAIGHTVTKAGHTVIETAVDVGETVGHVATQAGGSVAGTVTHVAGTVGSAAAQAGQAVAGTAVTVGGAIGQVALQATDRVGDVLDILHKNPQLQHVLKPFNVSWLSIVDQVDVVKAAARVQELQQQYPTESSAQIAHRLMLEKALYAAGLGFASSSVPGVAAALLMVDLGANLLLQAEMVYQIAAAYGLDLKESTRKAEVLAIFGLSLGGSRAIKFGSSYAAKAGLGFLRNVPIAGAVVGASVNAVMIYALGYAACRFYEAKQHPLATEATIADSQAQSEQFLKTAIDQEVIMDQILVHVILADNPDRTWAEILPELQILHLSPASLEAIAANLESPPPLEELLAQINADFAVPLLAQCQKIAELNGEVSPAEAEVMAVISQRLGLDLDSLQATYPEAPQAALQS